MSKQAADRARSSRAVVDAIRQHTDVIANAQRVMLTPAATRLGIEVPDLKPLLLLYADTLEHNAADFARKVAVHLQELLDDADPRARREVAARATRDYLSPLRKTVDGVFGDAGLRTLGFWEPLPSTTEVLRQYGQTVLDALLRPGLTLKPVLAVAGTQFDAAAHAAALRPLIDELTAALGEVSQEEAQATTTLIAKDGSMARNDGDFSGITGVTVQLARAAGLGEVADRIRPAEGEPGVLLRLDDSDDPAPSDSRTPTNGGGTTPTVKPKPIPPGMPGAEPFDDEP